MRDHLNANNMHASLGKYAFGFSWAAFACMAIATILFLMGVIPGGGEESANTGSRFGRKRSTRSRRSFVDNDSQHRVKEEYV